MTSSDAPSATSFESEASGLLESIARARKKVEGIAGVLDGTLDRFRERVDRLIRDSEVDNWRQVRIFTRDVETIAADLAKASKDKRLALRLVAVLDVALRKARRRDFYSAGRAWRKLDKIGEQGAEVRRLQAQYREGFRGVEARVRHLKAQTERLEKIPKPPTSPEEAKAFNDRVDRFNVAATAAYLDFLSRARADVAIPLLLEGSQWSEDVTILRRRVPAIVAFLERLGKMNDAADRGREIAASLADGTFEAGQVAARMYATHGEAAERKWRGALEKDIEGMRKEAVELSAVLKKFPEPTKVESG